MTRTKSSLKNITYAIIGQFLGILINFISRKVFVTILSSEYLGLNGLFGNILSILTLAELGIGTSLVYSLYKPLAENDNEKVKSLMQLYKRAYTIIGVVVLCAGSVLTPFIKYFVSEMPDINGIYIIYLMFVANAGVSYFFIYRRELIIADQKRYIATKYRYGFYFVLNIIQIVILLITHNYFLFLGIQIVFTITENIAITQKSNKLYPYLAEKNILPLEKSETAQIKKNVMAMMFHKIGGIVVNGTDNLIIAKFINVIAVGIYSNYLLIVTAFKTIISLMFASITASLGNLNVEATDVKREETFNNIFFIGSMIFGIIAVCLFNLFNPFINWWLGADYLFDEATVLVIVINVYITFMRQPCLTTRNAMGLFWYDRYKPLVESVINIVASLILVQRIGVAGVLIGTIISTVSTCLWWEPYVLYKYGLHTKLRKYFLRYSLCAITTVVCGGLCWFLCGFIEESGIASLLLKGLVCVFITIAINIAVFCRSDEFKYATNLLRRFIHIK